MLIELLPVEHAARTACFSQQSGSLYPAFGRQIRMGDDLKRSGDKSIRRQQSRGFAKLLVAARAAAAEIVVVHAGHVVMDERVAVQHFQRAGVVERLFRRSTAQFTRGQRQHGADAFAAAQQAVARGLGDLLVRGQKLITQLAQARFGQRRPGSKFCLVILVVHCTSSAWASRLASISSIWSLAASSVCLQ